MGQGFSLSDLGRLICRGFVNYWFWLGLAIFLVINKAAVIALIEQQLLVDLAHLLSINCLRIFGVPRLLLLPSDDLLKI